MVDVLTPGWYVHRRWTTAHYVTGHFTRCGWVVRVAPEAADQQRQCQMCLKSLASDYDERRIYD